jgi:hypothetical protein
MRFVDLLLLALALAAALSVVASEAALADAQDLRGVYWLALGAVSLRAAIQITRPGVR